MIHQSSQFNITVNDNVIIWANGTVETGPSTAYGGVADNWVNETGDVMTGDLNISASLNVTVTGTFQGDFNKSKMLGFGNVRIGSYSGTMGWGTITFETNFIIQSLWTIDNGGAGIRIY